MVAAFHGAVCSLVTSFAVRVPESQLLCCRAWCAAGWNRARTSAPLRHEVVQSFWRARGCLLNISWCSWLLRKDDNVEMEKTDVG